MRGGVGEMLDESFFYLVRPFFGSICVALIRGYMSMHEMRR